MSYLRDYLTYATANEAPEIFHVWAAYFCLSTVVARRCWMPFADDFVYPNIYAMFVGGAGNGKSEALNRAKRLLRELNIPMSASVETPEGMCRYIGGEPNAKPPIESPVKQVMKGPLGNLIEAHPFPIIANEFVDFISKNPEGWINLLNNIFDCGDYDYRTKNQGEDRLTSPYITLLGALTTEVATTLHKQNIIGTGMGRRTLFQFGERQWENPHPRPLITDTERAARACAIDHLRRVQKVTGPFTVTPAAIEFWDDWYSTNNKAVPRMVSNLKSWFGTKAARLQELAMLTSLSERLDLVIDVPHYQIPLAYLDILESDLPKVFGGVGRNELAGVAMRILEYVNALSVPETKASIKSKFFSECKPPMEFEDCIRFLVDSDKIKALDVQIGSSLQTLIASPKVVAHHVLRTASSSPGAVAAPLLEWAQKLAGNP